MLVLSRKLGERILVGDAWISIRRIGTGVVQLGIEAPKDVRIRREELVFSDKEGSEDK